MVDKWSTRRKGDYELRLTRTVNTPGRHSVELYLFIPPETTLSARTLSEQQFFFGSVAHSFGLMGLQGGDRAVKNDESFALLSPYFEIANSSWLLRYKASMGRLRGQLNNTNTPGETIARALRLSQAFAQRMRETQPSRDRQKRYLRQMDIYFSWFVEQFFLECMTRESFSALDEALRQSITDFLQQERTHRKEQDYLRDFLGTPTALWNRMSLYDRLLEYPISLRPKVAELGSGTRKLVKAATTMFIMSILTYMLFNVRNASETLSITLLLVIALMYGVRDMVREDMINVITRRLRRGKPRWRIRLRMPYTRQQVARQLVWVDYRNLQELPQVVASAVGRSANNDDAQVICYRSLLKPDKDTLEHDEIRERITLDFEALCEMIKVSRDRLYVCEEDEESGFSVQVHPIERQQDFHLLLVSEQPGQDQSSAQLWRLRLGNSGIVQSKSKDPNWPSPEEQMKRSWWDRITAVFKKN